MGDSFSTADKVRVDPLHQTILERITDGARAANSRAECLTVGLCGPQGSGKSTLTEILRRSLEERGLRVAALSLDDVYLTRREREILGRDVHPLLLTRGVPGTHDVPLALQTLAALRKPGTVSVPVFDKACDDRRPPADWVRVRAPVDVLLFEGWCVGAKPQPDASLSEPINALEREQDPLGIWRTRVNRALAHDYAPLFSQIDFLVLLVPPSFDVVHGWRLQQEQELARRLVASGQDTSQLMDADQVERFIRHYERLTRHIMEEMPARADLVISLDEQRRMTMKQGST